MKQVWVTAIVFALIIATGAVSRAAAQGRPEASGGYQYTYYITSSTNIPAGWFADVSIPLNLHSLRVVGEVNGLDSASITHSRYGYNQPL